MNIQSRLNSRFRKTCVRIGLICGFAALIAACSEQKADQNTFQALDDAIEAHGGYDKLKAASTWIAEIRRYQRGSSYVMTNYYRPGMVRLEMDIGNGKKSADVIGHPHCWGMQAPVTIPCSPETRENDRPRVIMEMAVQLWPLKEQDWDIRSTSTVQTDAGPANIITAHYAPLDTTAEFSFDAKTNLLKSIAIEGIKNSVKGTHIHEYSDYKDFCGVKMPAHNVKSFNGDTWVEEDILSLACQPVEESFFVRPEQVTHGNFTVKNLASNSLACTNQNTEEALSSALANHKLSRVGPTQTLFLEDGSRQLCVPVEGTNGQNYDDLIIRDLPKSEALSVFSLQAEDQNSGEQQKTLRKEAALRQLKPSGPIRMVKYDNDGMGMTGELVLEFQLPFEK